MGQTHPVRGPRPAASTEATEGSNGGMPPQHAKDQAPRQPHTQTPEVPQHAGHPHSRKVHPTVISRPAGPSAKAKPHLSQHSAQPRPPRRVRVNPKTIDL
ncbi:hypothetical protein ILYODFUR_038194 [Ilyodon furcidens]|uniref:Uncharacterized protein n=1 Tax=Ilyodon furcidens TaxID=33524 RepID=A0ABV0VKH8_9TELE